MLSTSARCRYDRAMDGMTQHLLKKSEPSGLTYVSDWNGRANTPKVYILPYYCLLGSMYEG